MPWKLVRTVLSQRIAKAYRQYKFDSWSEVLRYRKRFLHCPPLRFRSDSGRERKLKGCKCYVKVAA